MNTYNGITLRQRPSIYRDEAVARDALAHGGWVKPMRLVMGEVGEWMIVCPADAARLERGGYEIAR